MVQSRLTSGKPMYRLIMMDYKMPSINGADTVKMILAALKATNVRPYIACMSNFSNNQAIRVSCIKAGMDEFVCKPIFK